MHPKDLWCVVSISSMFNPPNEYCPKSTIETLEGVTKFGTSSNLKGRTS